MLGTKEKFAKLGQTEGREDWITNKYPFMGKVWEKNRLMKESICLQT